MNIVPETRSGKIGFYQTHLPVWAAAPESIGLTAEAVEQMQGLVDAAHAAQVAHELAQQAALTATTAFHEAVRRMHSGGAGGAVGAGGEGVVGGATLLQLIKVYAQSSGDNNVYSRGEIPAPAKPGRPGSALPPGTPYQFDADLHQTGAIELTWKCDNPDGTVGTIYQVKRGTEDGELSLVGTVGEKRFVDRAIVPGTKTCTYEVTALRSTGKGSPGRYTIQFGGAQAGPQFEVKSGKLAA